MSSSLLKAARREVEASSRAAIGLNHHPARAEGLPVCREACEACPRSVRAPRPPVGCIRVQALPKVLQPNQGVRLECRASAPGQPETLRLKAVESSASIAAMDSDPAVERDPAQKQQMQRAVAQWLRACGLDLDHRDLRGTPERVAELWSTHIISGYAMDEAQILGDVVKGEGATELVVVRDIPCHGMCPHHLMPWTGRATVAYLPGDCLVGFGRLNDLVHCHTRRLTLQERACNDIADALMTHLDARGAACVITAAHNCLNVPGDKHATRVLTSSYRGELQTRSDLQIQLTR